MQRIERKSGRLESSSALNKFNDQDDDGNYEQEVDQAAANVANEAKKPEHDQDDNYRSRAWVFLRLSYTFVGVFIQKFIYSPSFFRTSSRTVLLRFHKAGEFKEP